MPLRYNKAYIEEKVKRSIEETQSFVIFLKIFFDDHMNCDLFEFINVL